MADNIVLTGSQRSIINEMVHNARLSGRTQERLSTGRKINTIVDSAVMFYRAKSLYDRAEKFNNYKSDIEQGIQLSKTGGLALEKIETMLSTMRGIVEGVFDLGLQGKTQASTEIMTYMVQISNLVKDTSYRGNAFLNAALGNQNDQTIQLGTLSSSILTIESFQLLQDINAGNSSRGIFAGGEDAFDEAAAGNFEDMVGAIGNGAEDIEEGFSKLGETNDDADVVSGVRAFIRVLEQAEDRMKAYSTQYATSVDILTTRLGFTEDYVVIHETGGDKITLANQEEEGANLVALQTRQQISLQSLRVSGQQLRSIVTLFQ